MRTVFLLVLLALPVGRTAIASAQRPALSPRDTTPIPVVREYVAAFNAKDLDAMMGLVASDIVWMSVSGDSLTDVGRGVGAFRQMIAGYFRAVPSARSKLSKIDATGPWVTTHEQTRWEASPAGVGGQTSLVVYEVRDGLIRRAWFYPSLPLPGPVSERLVTDGRLDTNRVLDRRRLEKTSVRGILGVMTADGTNPRFLATQIVAEEHRELTGAAAFAATKSRRARTPM